MVEWIEINGKEYPIRIGYYVMKRVKEVTGKSLQDAFKEADDNIEIHETILWAALKTGAYAEKQELDLNEDDIAFILDTCFEKYLKVFSSDKFFPSEKELEKVEAKGDTPGKDKMERKGSPEKKVEN